MSPYLCLNMIVKDEAHIIRQTLEKLIKAVPLIDYYVISDTGSSDDTINIISTFFQDKKIPGEIHQDTWKDFAHNRSLALRYAYNKSKYLIVFDADDEFVGIPNITPTNLTCDCYEMIFGNQVGFRYNRILIVNNSKKWVYKSVRHEYIECLEPLKSKGVIDGKYYIISGRTGNRSKNPNKYLDDAKALEEAYYESKKGNDKDRLYLRYAFYCANSYFDFNDFENAIKWYKIVLQQDNWVQEKYVACLKLFNCFSKQPNTVEQALFYLIESFNYDDERVESIVEIIFYYNSRKMYKIAYNYYTAFISDFYDNKYIPSLSNSSQAVYKDKLFVDYSKSDFILPLQLVEMFYHLEKYEQGFKYFDVIFKRGLPNIRENHIQNVFDYFSKYIVKINKNISNKKLELLVLYISFLKETYQINVYSYECVGILEKYGLKIPPAEKEIIKERKNAEIRKLAEKNIQLKDVVNVGDNDAMMYYFSLTPPPTDKNEILHQNIKKILDAKMYEQKSDLCKMMVDTPASIIFYFIFQNLRSHPISILYVNHNSQFKQSYTFLMALQTFLKYSSIHIIQPNIKHSFETNQIKMYDDSSVTGFDIIIEDGGNVGGNYETKLKFGGLYICMNIEYFLKSSNLHQLSSFQSLILIQIQKQKVILSTKPIPLITNST
jgi:hypothetical protein